MKRSRGWVIGLAFGAALIAALLAGTAGYQIVLGRIDPALAIPPLLAPALMVAWALRFERVADRRFVGGLTLAFFALMQAGLAVFLAGTIAALQVALTLAAGVVAGLVADRIVQRAFKRRWRKGLAALLAAILWFAGGHAMLGWLYGAPAPAAVAPPVTMLSGLPLRWAGGGDLAAQLAQGSADDPALAALEARMPVALVDSLIDNPPAAGGRLLLAHPRALAPQELVAIDAFVRGGGRAVILADALSQWPPAFPLGDSRNPPVTSLLTPLLDHWGLKLEGAEAGDNRMVDVDVGARRLRLASAGRFGPLPPGCTSHADGRVVRCRIGEGEAWIVGDADLLLAPLWQSPVNGLPHLRRADTMEWLAERLGPDSAAEPWLRPVWIRPSR